MRIGILSDIHANYEALEALRPALDKSGLDELICLGDTVGYGGSPNPCSDWVRSNTAGAVLGNHDAAVSGRMDYRYYYNEAREVLDWTRETLSGENQNWLKSLPEVYRRWGCLFCHSSPVEPMAFDYIYTTIHVQSLLKNYKELSPLTFIGHSHLYRVFAIGPKRQIAEITASEVTLAEDKKHLICCSSVGQPRDYDNRAGAVVYDTDERRITLLRCDYDIQKASEKILKAGNSPNFAQRLFEGM